ncbi:hypothetical protein Tco_0843290 [Tanacetum coccineum]|uniref:Uncharacterized protein n=1 Tax=Tanacetum coccineum TaxID=301880 RepID=A0ABQ5B2X3_9ASTR
MHHQASFHHQPRLINHTSVHHGVATEHSFEVNPFATTEHEPFVNVFAPDPNSEASSSRILTITTPNQSTQPHEHLRKWTDSYPLDNIIGNPSRPVSTRKQLATDALWRLDKKPRHVLWRKDIVKKKVLILKNPSPWSPDLKLSKYFLPMLPVKT